MLIFFFEEQKIKMCKNEDVNIFCFCHCHLNSIDQFFYLVILNNSPLKRFKVCMMMLIFVCLHFDNNQYRVIDIGFQKDITADWVPDRPYLM